MVFNSKSIIEKFYTLCGKNQYKCLCGILRKANVETSGYSNLISHVKDKHKEELDHFVTERKENDGITKFVISLHSSKAKNLYSWIDWIISDNHPFSFVENENTRKYCNLSPMSLPSFMKYITLLKIDVIKTISQKLHDKFVIIFDSWSKGTKHYTAMFAQIPQTKEKYLLSCSTFDDSASFSSSDFVTHFGIILKKYQKSLSDILFMICDNCNTNKSLAKLLNVNMIGCYSHRFNLSVKKYLKVNNYSILIKKVNALMKKYRTIKCAGLLKERCKLSAKCMNVTRWSSIYAMLKRYFEISDFFYAEDDNELYDLLLSVKEKKNLEILFDILTNFESVTKALQADDCDFNLARNLLDETIKQYPDMSYYLAEDALITFSTAFESGIYKIIKGNEIEMTELEKKECTIFLNSGQEKNIREESIIMKRSIADTVLSKKEMCNNNLNSIYINLDWIVPTSNICERLFSIAGLVLNDRRMSMNDENFETAIFLRNNKCLWSISTIQKLISLRQDN